MKIGERFLYFLTQFTIKLQMDIQLCISLAEKNKRNPGVCLSTTEILSRASSAEGDFTEHCRYFH